MRKSRYSMRLEDLGLIGNCQILRARRAQRRDRLVLPAPLRLGARLLDPARRRRRRAVPRGARPAANTACSAIVENTNVLETTFETTGGAFRVLDFAPRFVQYDRIFRPTQLLRIVEPLAGTPRIRVLCDPRLGWSKQPAGRTPGSHHVRFEGFEAQLRLTTDIPLSYLSGQPFALTERQHLVLTWGAPVEEPLPALCERFLQETLRYWQRWVKHATSRRCSSSEVIRSALALKLHCFEDTGAIVAAMTTSIPEAPGSGRTWDYRYCWLRDAYYALSAFRLLGHFEEREQFVRYLLNVASSTPDLDLAPLYRIDADVDLEERILDQLARLRRRAAGAGRQRRRGAAAERRVRRDGAGAVPGLPRRTLQRRAVARDARPAAAARRQGHRRRGHAGRRHLGVASQPVARRPSPA